MFIETQQGLVNGDYVTIITLPYFLVTHWRFEVKMGDGTTYVQQYSDEASARRAFKQNYEELITNNG